MEPVLHHKWLGPLGVPVYTTFSGRLGAVDVFTRENALTVALSQIVDAPRDI